MKLKKMIAGNLLALALVFPNAVFAEDFTFNVGLNLTNLFTDEMDVEAKCYVYDDYATTANLIGFGQTMIELSADGDFNQTVQVKFNAQSGKNPAEAGDYRCFLIFVKPTVVTVPNRATDEVCNDANNAWRCAKDGTVLVRKLTGDIP